MTTPVDGWDSTWFAQVRTLLSALSEAERAAGIRQNRAYGPAAADRLRQITDGSRERLDRLFGLYLTQNPAEALRIADDYGLRETFLNNRDVVRPRPSNPISSRCALLASGMPRIR